jgi:hypothetical protein
MGKKLIQGLFSFAVFGYFVYSAFFAWGSKLSFGPDKDVYYKSGATETDARRVGEYLKTMGFFAKSSAASIQVVKDGEDYVVRFVTVDSAWDDPEMKKAFANIGYLLGQSAFPGKKLTVEMCDTSFETKATLQPEAPEETVDTEPEKEAAETPSEATESGD